MTPAPRPIISELGKGIDNIAVAATYGTRVLENMRTKIRNGLTDILDIETPTTRYHKVRNRVVYGGIQLTDAIAELGLIGPARYLKDGGAHAVGLATALFNKDKAKAKAAAKGLFLQTPRSLIKNLTVKPFQGFVQGKRVDLDVGSRRTYDANGAALPDEEGVFGAGFRALDSAGLALAHTTTSLENIKSRTRDGLTDILEVDNPAVRYEKARNRVVYGGAQLGDTILDLGLAVPRVGSHALGLAAALHDNDKARAKAAAKGTIIQTPFSILKNITVQPYRAIVQGKRVQLDTSGSRNYDLAGRPLRAAA